MPFFVLFRITDNLTTFSALEKFNHDYYMESNRMARWLLLNINLPDIVVLFLSEIIVTFVLFSIGWFIYRKWKTWRVVIKMMVFGLTIGSLIVSISNFLVYLLR
jgi:RsiW-degrading membrane proteinase PrsW (M82 family)